MRFIVLFSTLSFVLLFNSVSAQNWFTKSYSLKFADNNFKELIDGLFFSALEGSRTDDYRITIDTSQSMIHFSFSTMGGEEASLIMEKEEKKMVILFWEHIFKMGFYTFQDQTFSEFQNGYFVIMDGNVVELNEENKLLRKASNQNHELVTITPDLIN